MIARNGKRVPPREHALELVRQELGRGRSEAGLSDWAGVGKRARLARMELGRLAEELEKIWGGPIGKLDEFPDDGFGWFNSMSLMGNDPARWEFTLVPEEAGWIDLSGRWDFRIDPAHDGEKEGWSAAGMDRKGWRSLRVPGAWERQGVRQENDHSPWDCPYPLKDLRCDDKPYNGYAWYRRELRVPESWRGQRVILELGKVANWLRLFVNGRLIEERANGGKFLLPAGTWNAGETNIFAVEVYNHDNFGGLVEGPVGLGVEGRVWAAKATPGPLWFANEVEARGEGGARQHWTTVVSAMSPAVLVATDRAQIDVSGWEAKGFELADRLRFDRGGSEWVKMDLGRTVMERSGERFDWVLLDAAASGSEDALIAPRPVLLRFSERPEAMEWGTKENARGGNSEAQMFDDWKEWGFDHCRYAFAWNQDWDIPLQRRLGGPINEDTRLWERMDHLVKEHSERGIMAMLCYFFNEDQPQADSRKLVRNSTRYWQMHPETRTNAYALWRRIAERYKGLPAGAVAYDFFNEPAYMHQDDWNRIIRDLTRLVREVDRVHLIVCEAGDGWSQPEWFSWLQPTGDTNTIYSFHHYGKHWGYDYDEYYPGYKSTPERQADAILEAVLFGIRHQVAMHCGEFGISMISPGDDHLVWLDDYLGMLEIWPRRI